MFVLMLLPMKEHKVPFKACFHTWKFSTCLCPRDEPTDQGHLCEDSAVPQRGRTKTQNEFCESCAKQKWLTSLKLKSVSRKLSQTWISSSSSGCWPITEGSIGQSVNTGALYALSWGVQAVGAGKGVIYGGLVPTAPAELHWRGCSNMHLGRREPKELPEGGMGPCSIFLNSWTVETNLQIELEPYHRMSPNPVHLRCLVWDLQSFPKSLSQGQCLSCQRDAELQLFLLRYFLQHILSTMSHSAWTGCELHA